MGRSDPLVNVKKTNWSRVHKVDLYSFGIDVYGEHKGHIATKWISLLGNRLPRLIISKWKLILTKMQPKLISSSIAIEIQFSSYKNTLSQLFNLSYPQGMIEYESYAYGNKQIIDLL